MSQFKRIDNQSQLTKVETQIKYRNSIVCTNVRFYMEVAMNKNSQKLQLVINILQKVETLKK